MQILCYLQTPFFLILSLCFTLSTQSQPNATSSLNSLLQAYSFKSFLHPRTGILYDSPVPSNLTGIKLSAMRLRTGSLRKRGLTPFKQFTIPNGTVVNPYVTRVILVYQNLANYSRLYYPLPGYDFLAPVLGLLAYNAENLNAVNLKELDLTVLNDPIRINFSDLEGFQEGDGSSVKCVRFDSKGGVSFSESKGNVCETKKQGHFSVVVKSVPSSPSPKERKKKRSEFDSKIWIIVGSVIGGLILLGVLVCIVLRCLSYKKGERMRKMVRAGERGEALRMTLVGETRAPSATSTRTQPMLEKEYTS